jgi:flagellin-like protein
MKANRKFVQGDEAVSPVIAVILMVAITVVLAATVYLWVSGFGSEQGKLVQASFVAKAVDLPVGAGKDSDSSDDAIEITFSSGSGDLTADEIQIVVDGVTLNWTASDNFVQGTDGFQAGDLCTTSPGGDTDDTWERGSSVYLFDTSSSAASDASDCDGPSASGDLVSWTGIHLIKVIVKGQVVLDTQVEVHDNASA